ncbi:hypothetical protein D9619_004261 [Psilocybe cf. subviscida]|uniref:Uncharacterized protein n=1 Tax=Psilocybe cf. subviscida TaxID=2480587 RepID=A0A8H5BQ68_9AGAR|nr:hypothetical protein D9619_004261 [Psilocybe cf. subviscida]
MFTKKNNKQVDNAEESITDWCDVQDVGFRIMVDDNDRMILALGAALPGVFANGILRLGEDDVAGMGWGKFMCFLLFDVGTGLAAPYFIFPGMGDARMGERTAKMTRRSEKRIDWCFWWVFVQAFWERKKEWRALNIFKRCL